MTKTFDKPRENELYVCEEMPMDIITVDEHEYILDFEFEGWAYLRPVRDGTAYLPGICVPVDALPQTKDETEKS